MHLFIEMPPDASTSTCTRRRRRCGSSSSRSCTRCCAGRSATRSGRGRRRSCSSRPFAPRPGEPRPMTHSGRARGRHRSATGGNRRQAGPGVDPSSAGAAWSRATRRSAGVQAARRSGAARHPADDAARPVPRHVHHRGRRRGRGDHRPARRARARAVRAGHGAADGRPPREPAAADADPASSCRRPSAQALAAARRRRSSGSASRSRSSAATALRVSARAGAARRREECEAAVRALAEDLEGLDRGAGVEDALRRIAATMACHAAVKANYPLTLREDALHPRRAAPHGVFDGLPARPAGGAAPDAAGDREELSANLTRLIARASW